MNDVFEEVKNMVDDGMSISGALKKLGLNRATFYSHLTKEQKILIGEIRTSRGKFHYPDSPRLDLEENKLT